MVESGRTTLNDGKDFVVWRLGMGRTAEILDIQVSSERRKGVGRELVELAVRTIRGNAPDVAIVYAITRLKNTIAHQFYEALGFRLVGRLHYFYRNSGDKSEHALVYGLDL